MEGGARAWAWEPAREAGSGRRDIVPDHAQRMADRRRPQLAVCGVSTGRAGLRHAAQRTGAVMGVMPGLVGWSGHGRAGIAVADHGRRRADRRRRCRPPSRPRSVRKSAPPRPSGRSEEISVTAGASKPTFRRHDLITRKSEVEIRFAGYILRAAGNNRPLPVSSRDPSRIARSPYYPETRFACRACNRQWRNPNHFANCSNFEQSLLKLMTSRKRWSTTAGSGWPQG